MNSNAFIYFILITLSNLELKTCVDVCHIRISMSENPNPSIEANVLRSFKSGWLKERDEIEIRTNLVNRITCLTNEKVRFRNRLNLQWPNSTNNSAFFYMITNTTLTNGDISYLKGDLKLNSTKFATNQRLNLVCRFLPVNTSIYCEKKVSLRIISEKDYKLRLFRNVSLIILAVGFFSLILKLNLGDQILAIKKTSFNIKTSTETNDNEKVCDLKQEEPVEQIAQIKIEISEKFQKFEIKDDYDFSIYPLDTQTTTSQTMIITDTKQSSLPIPNERLID